MLKDVVGYEFDWLAHDCEGRVGHFSTAGSGLAPASVLSRSDAFSAACEQLIALPPSCDAVAAEAGNISDWLEFARRGLYSHDADFNGGPYRLIAIPTSPIHIDSLPSSLAALVRGVRLPLVAFGRDRVLPWEALERGS